MTTDISRRTLLRGMAASAVVLPLGGVLGACSTTADGGGSTDLLARGKKQGYLRIAIANEPPYTKVNSDGTVTGCEPDVFAAVIKRMGIPKIQGTTTPYDSMIPGLKANRWDAVTAGLFMKESRCAEVNYAEPVIVSTESFGVKKGNPKGILTIADVKKNTSLKIAVLPGAFEFGILQTAKVSSDQIVKVKDSRSGLEALKAGRADAYLLPTLSLQDLTKTDNSFEVTDPVKDAPKTGSSAAFRKSDTKFQKAYNVELAKFKATSEFASILKKWGFDPEAAKGVTTAELCKNPG